MSEIRKVNRPVFRLSKPGEDVKWTTRKNEPSQLNAIRQKRKELLAPLPKTLPEKMSQNENGEYEDLSGLKVDTQWPPPNLSEDPQTEAELSRDTEAGLRYLSDDELVDYANEATTDGPLEAVDEELERRGWISREPTPEDIVKREYLRKRLAE